MDNSLVRVGVFGAWRGCAYIKCLAQIDGVKVTAVCDKSEKRRNDALAACEKIGCGDVRMFDDYEEFITSGLFDALIPVSYTLQLLQRARSGRDTGARHGHSRFQRNYSGFNHG